LEFNTESRKQQIAGKNISDTVPSFLSPKTFSIFVDSIASTQNYVDGKFSTLLASVPCRGGLFGDFITYPVIAPFFKRLNTEYIPKLTLIVKDENNVVVWSSQPMTFVLEVRDSHTS